MFNTRDPILYQGQPGEIRGRTICPSMFTGKYHYDVMLENKQWVFNLTENDLRKVTV